MENQQRVDEYNADLWNTTEKHVLETNFSIFLKVTFFVLC